MLGETALGVARRQLQHGAGLSSGPCRGLQGPAVGNPHSSFSVSPLPFPPALRVSPFVLVFKSSLCWLRMVTWGGI